MDDASACALALTFIILLRLCHQGPPPCHSSRDEALLQVLFTADPGLLDAHQEIFALDASADPVVRFAQATGLISHRSPVDWARLPLLVPVLRAAWASHAASSPAPLPLACACACFVLSQRLRRPGPVISEPCVLGKAAAVTDLQQDTIQLLGRVTHSRPSMVCHPRLFPNSVCTIFESGALPISRCRVQPDEIDMSTAASSAPHAPCPASPSNKGFRAPYRTTTLHGQWTTRLGTPMKQLWRTCTRSRSCY